MQSPNVTQYWKKQLTVTLDGVCGPGVGGVRGGGCGVEIGSPGEGDRQPGGRGICGEDD